MTELGVTLMAIGAWALAAGSAGFVGSFVVQRFRDRQAAKRAAKDFDASGGERPVTAASGLAPTSDPSLVLVRTSGPAFADREMAHATSTAA